MKKICSILLLVTVLVSCSNGQPPHTLSAKSFAEKIQETPNGTIVDVRTPVEFSSGHLENALNYDWNGSEFNQQIATLDKSKPVFVYCLSGGRSSAAADKMRSAGFKEVYELEGGIMQWRSEDLPETTNNRVSSPGMSEEAFRALLNSDKLILIDFYADWCVPCKKMEPYLNEISTELKNSVTVVRINVEENQDLCKKMGISSIPVLQIYKNKKMTWTTTGLVEKEEVMKHLQ